MKVTILDLRNEPYHHWDFVHCDQCGCAFEGDEMVVEWGNGVYCGETCVNQASRRQATRLEFAGDEA